MMPHVLFLMIPAAPPEPVGLPRVLPMITKWLCSTKAFVAPFFSPQAALALICLRLLLCLPCTYKLANIVKRYLVWLQDVATILLLLCHVVPSLWGSMSATTILDAASILLRTLGTATSSVYSVGAPWLVVSLVFLFLIGSIGYVRTAFHLVTNMGYQSAESYSTLPRDNSPTVATIGITSTGCSLVEHTNLAGKVELGFNQMAHWFATQDQKIDKLITELRCMNNQLKSIMLTVPSVSTITTCLSNVIEDLRDEDSSGGKDLGIEEELNPSLP